MNEPSVLMSPTDVATAFVTVDQVTVTEPDMDEIAEAMWCFRVVYNQPLKRDIVFEIVPTPETTATLNEDFTLNATSITVPANSSEGVYMSCVSVYVLGDGLVEDDLEVVVYNLVPQAMQDRVMYPEGSGALVVNIMDNDGKN